jgi:hypothetical protein
VSETIELHPRLRQRALFIAGCLSFVAGGAFIVVVGEDLEKVVGLACAVFGAWALVIWLRRMRDDRAIVLSAHGLRPATGGEIPWADIEDVGVFAHRRAKGVGVRLRSVERYAASFTDADRRLLERRVTGMRALGGVAGAAQQVSAPFDEDAGELTRIAGDRSLSTLAGMIAFSRETFGYDWTFGALELDRSPEAFATLLREHAARASTPVSAG